MVVIATGPKTDRDMIVAFVTIEALNAWAMFSRSFYLSCALGARTERKKIISIGVSMSDPIGAAVTYYKKNAKPNSAGHWHRRDEPAWHDPNVLMKVCSNCNCSIQMQIERAFSLNQNVFNHLPVFRNFFAHRNAGTSRAACNIGPSYTLPTSLSPADLLMAFSPGATTPLLFEWIAELNITAEFLCKV